MSQNHHEHCSNLEIGAEKWTIPNTNITGNVDFLAYIKQISHDRGC